MISIITLEQLSKYIDVTDENRELLASLVEVVTSQINNKLGYDLNYQIRNEKYKESKFNPIYVRYRPLDKLEFVKINDKSQSVYNTTSRYIDLDKCNSCSSCYHQKYRCYKYDISYYAGVKFGTDDVPEDLIYYISLWINDMLAQLSQEDKIKSYKINDISYTFKDSKHEKVLFDYLKRWFL